MVQVDPVLVGIVAVLLFVVLFLFLLFRRTMKGFADGLREGQRRD
jgi:preprotein translocase subunit YajC